MMRFAVRVGVACLVFAALAWSGSARAADFAIGSVRAVRGDVTRESGGEPQPLVAKAPVYLGDVIVAGAGKAQLSLNDGTIISIGENTRLRLEVYRATTNAFTTRLHLVSGVLRLLVAKVTAVGQFEIETETAIAAVRGTDWLIDATAEQTSVAIISGRVAVTARDVTSAATVVLDGPGLGTDVRRGMPPTGPVTWGAARFAKTLARASF